MKEPNIIETLKAAFAYATFKTPELRDAVKSVLTSHANDLNDVGYEQSTETTSALTDLTNSMNEYDELQGTKKEELADAIAESKIDNENVDPED